MDPYQKIMQERLILMERIISTHNFSLEEQLLQAVKNDDTQLVYSLVSKGNINIDCRDRYGNTPLMIALQNINTDSVPFLLKNGASVHTRNGLQRTPLHIALTNNVPQTILQLLLNHHADINAQDDRGDTPLFIILKQRNVDVALTNLLLKSNFNPKLKDNFSTTGLHIALKTDAPLSIIQTLLEYNFDINAQDCTGCTSLHDYFKNSKKNIEILQLLLSKCAHTDSTDHSGDTPFHYLVKTCTSIINYHNNMPFIKLLLKAGAGFYKKNHAGETPYGLLNAYTTGNNIKAQFQKIEAFHVALINKTKGRLNLSKCKISTIEDYLKIHGPGALNAKWWLFFASGIDCSKTKMTQNKDSDENTLPRIPNEVRDEITKAVLMPYGISMSGVIDLVNMLYGTKGKSISSEKTMYGKRNPKDILYYHNVEFLKAGIFAF